MHTARIRRIFAIHGLDVERFTLTKDGWLVAGREYRCLVPSRADLGDYAIDDIARAVRKALDGRDEAAARVREAARALEERASEARGASDDTFGDAMAALGSVAEGVSSIVDAFTSDASDSGSGYDGGGGDSGGGGSSGDW